MSSLPDTGRAMHPKIRSSSLVWYPMDEDCPSGPTCEAVAFVGGSDFDLSKESTLPIPAVTLGPTGRARRFTGQVLTSAIGSAAARDAMEASWTMHVLMRMRAVPSGTDVVFGYMGTSGDGSAPANNFMATMRFDGSLLPCMFWEQGAGGSNVQTDATVGPAELNVWGLETWVKTITTAGPGPAGRCTLERYRNGVLLETFTDVVNTSGGTTAKWHLGAQISGGAVSAPVTADIGFAAVYTEALSATEVALDFRRLGLGGCSVRRDGRVLLEDGVGDLRDLTNLEGMDWFQNATIEKDKDSPVARCSVEAVRECGGLTLASLRTESKVNLSDITDPTSYAPFLTDEKRDILVEAATVPIGITARADEMVTRLDGRTDRISFASDPVRIEARDRGARFIQAHSEEEYAYSSDTAPVASEDIIQQLFDDTDNAAGARPALPFSFDPETIYAPVASLFLILEYAQALEPLLAGARKVAAQRGWDFRLRYDPNPDERRWRMTYYEPPRDAVDASFYLTDDDITSRQEATVDAEDRRTHCRVAFPGVNEPAVAPTVPAGFVVEDFEAGDVDDEGNRLPGFVLIRHTESATDIGRYWMGISEYQASQISDLSQAKDMAVGCLRDTLSGGFLMTVDSPYLTDALLDDYILFARSELHTAPQRLSIVGSTEKLGDVSSMVVRVSGAAKAGYKRWLDIETRGRNARPAHHRKDGLYTNVDFGRRQEALRDTVQRSKMLRGGRFLQTFNHDFAQKHRGTGFPPDGWVVTDGVWGTDLEFDETAQVSGGRSVVLHTAVGDSELTSDPMPIAGEAEVYAIEVTNDDAQGLRPIGVRIAWYDAVDVFISDSVEFLPAIVGGPVGFKLRRGPGLTAPAGARFARVVMRNTATTLDTFVDALSIVKTAPEFRVYQLNTVNFVVSGSYIGTGFTEQRDYGDNFAGQTWTITQDGPYRIDWGAVASKGGGGNLLEAAVKLTHSPFGGVFTDFLGPLVNDSQTPGTPVGTQEIRLSGHDEVQLLRGDQIRLQSVATWTGVAPQLLAGENNTYLAAKLITAD